MDAKIENTRAYHLPGTDVDFPGTKECSERHWVDDSGKWHSEYRYLLADGKSVTVVGNGEETVALPAAAGFYESVALPDNADPDTYDIAGNVHREPVIGWWVTRGEGQSWVNPITLVHAEDYYPGDQRFVLAPDGSITRPMSSENSSPMCASLDEWIGAVRVAWKARLAAGLADAKLCPTCGHDRVGSRRRQDLDDEIPF
jgi:hypothetical protein